MKNSLDNDASGTVEVQRERKRQSEMQGKKIPFQESILNCPFLS